MSHPWAGVAQARARLLAALTLGFLCACGMLLMLTPTALSVAWAASPARPLGSGTVTTCDETALNAALAGGGTVTFSTGDCIITVTASLLITAPTTIDGAGQSVTLSGGNARRIITTTVGVGTLTILNITLTRGLVNSGALPDNSGGALFVRGALVLSSTTIISNSATGDGGGAYVTSTLMLTNAQFLSNTTNVRGGGVRADGATTLNGGLFQNNRSTSSQGGGLYANTTLSLSGTQFLGNTANLAGGGAYAESEATVNGGLFQNNAGNFGGGMFAGSLVLTDTQFVSNTANSAGGGTYAFGAAALNGGLFQNNRTNTQGGGLYVGSTLTLTGTQFVSNTATGNGGGARADGATTLNGGLFQNNRSANSTGGGLYAGSTLTLTGTQFLGNTGMQGGGVYHNNGTGRVVNALFARNVATSTLGAGLYLNSTGSMQILHTTIASPTVVSGSAIYIVSGTVSITDTIIVSHSIGISHTAGTVYEDYNLFFGNDQVGFISGGTNDVSGDPWFVNPASDNYHLTIASAAIDAGTDAGVTADFDGDPRPIGAGFDIGYDEFGFPTWRLYLPLIKR
jgi:predicted outer membrane repeat protein